MVSADLFDDSSDAHGAGRRDCSPGADDAGPGGETTLRSAQEDRALDLAALDVCLRDRRGDLPAPLPDLPATLICWRVRRPQRIRRQIAGDFINAANLVVNGLASSWWHAPGRANFEHRTKLET